MIARPRHILTLLLLLVLVGSVLIYNRASPLVPFSQTAALADLEPYLVGHYAFDGNAVDNSSSANHGSMNGNPTYVSGKIGQAISLDGNDDWVNISIDSINTRNATICAWVNPSRVSGFNTLISNGRFILAPYTNYLGTYFRMSSNAPQSTYVSSTNPIVTNAWQHICAVRTSDGNGSHYINGTLSVSGTSGAPVIGFGLKIGSNLGESLFAGLVDDVRIYNKQLDSSEIEHIFRFGGGTPAASNGACGVAAKSYTLNELFPQGTLCSSGNANPSVPGNPLQGAPSSWSCTGSNGGSAAFCAAVRSISDIDAPSKPDGLTFSQLSTSRISLTWGASSDTVGVSAYHVYKDGVRVGTPSINTYTISSLSLGVRYRFEIVAADAAGNLSATSSVLNVTLTPTITQSNLPGSNILADSRRVDWSTAGAGPIPDRTVTCATLNPGATSAHINAAIAACQSGQVVYLNPGTYNITSGIIFNAKDNVTLRGAGPDKTTLSFTSYNVCSGKNADVCIVNGDPNWSGGPRNIANWVSGYEKGNREITLSNVNNLREGSIIILDQINDTNADTGEVWNVGSGSEFSGCGECYSVTGRGFGTASPRQQTQVTTVLECGATSRGGQCTTNSVTLEDPLYMPNWRADRSPGAWWSNELPITGVGIEDITLDHTRSVEHSFGLVFYNSYRSWMKNVRSLYAGRAHVRLDQSPHITVRDSYFHGKQSNGAVSYGIESWTTSADLVENNILHHGPGLANGGNSGSVFAYNYVIDDDYINKDWMQADFYLHSPGNNYILVEGGDEVGIIYDDIHGTANFITSFRTRFRGTEENKKLGTAQQTIAVHNYAFTRYTNLIGNVLGTKGYHNFYETYYIAQNSDYSKCQTSVYALGFSHNGCTTKREDAPGNRFLPNDPLVRNTMFRWGNWDTVTDTSRFVASEAPSGLSKYANFVPSTQVLPPSLYLSSRPSWWTVGTPWPAIGPDVTGGTVSGTEGHVYKIPAARCYLDIMGGRTDHLSGILNFNANNCYSNSIQPVDPSDQTPPVASAVASVSTSRTATITWTTNEAATSSVQYGLTTSFGNRTAVNSSLSSNHSHTLLALQPNTTYHYRVISTDASGNTQTSQTSSFTTPLFNHGERVVTILDITKNLNGVSVIVLPKGAEGEVVAGPSVVGGFKTWSVVFDNDIGTTCTNNSACSGIQNWDSYSFGDEIGTAPQIRESYLSSLVTEVVLTPNTPGGGTPTISRGSGGGGGSGGGSAPGGAATTTATSTTLATSATSSLSRSPIITLTPLTRTLAKGTSDAQVNTVQAILFSQGLLTTYTRGTFDQKTEDAVKAFQLKYRIISSCTTTNGCGKVGPKTMIKLNEFVRGITPVSTPQAAAVTFTRSLSVGATGLDVKALQVYLNANGFKVASTGAGSPGKETTYFGKATKAALIKFQVSKGITPATGTFGPKTRAAVGR